MDKERMRGLLISDFNIGILSNYLTNDDDTPSIETIVAPFGQVTQSLMQKESDSGMGDFAVIWTRPEGVIKSFGDLILFKSPPAERIFDEVNEFASLILDVCDRWRFVFIPTWVLPHYYRGFGMLDMKKGMGVANTLMQMNLMLSERLGHKSNIFILDSQRWLNSSGKNAFNPRLWYRGKIAFGNDVYKEATRDIKSAIRGLLGLSKKIVILDLDETLWGGIVGDVGWRNIVLGGHDPLGEAYVDFQRALKSLTNRGILLGIVSKNDERVAIEAIENHPEMVLRLDDFAGWRINWNDKAENIVELLSDLNLGVESAVFIDDSPVERARVREALPGIFVPEWTDDPMLYKSTLLNLRCFDTPLITEEDAERARMYRMEQQRKELKKTFTTLDEWLKSLEIKVVVEELNEVNLPRTAQLLNKTNQMNLTTRRMTEDELLEWARHDGRRLWTFRVSDRFGDQGLTGIISLEVSGRIGTIVDFVLSCRVMGRKVEESMLFVALNYAKSAGLKEVKAVYYPTEKNRPCLEFWQRSGFAFDEKTNVFTWDMNRAFDKPAQVEIIQS